MTKCAICGMQKCVDNTTKHLLGSFDGTFDDQGLHGVGLGGGAIYGISEIGSLLDAVQLARVKAWEQGGARAAPPSWIAAHPELNAYFTALGDEGFDLRGYESHREAAGYLANSTRRHGQRVRTLLESLLEVVGWSGITSNDEDDVRFASSSYLLWWDDNAEEVAKRLSQKFAEILKEVEATEVPAVQEKAEQPRVIGRALSSKPLHPSLTRTNLEIISGNDPRQAYSGHWEVELPGARDAFESLREAANDPMTTNAEFDVLADRVFALGFMPDRLVHPSGSMYTLAALQYVVGMGGNEIIRDILRDQKAGG